MFFKKKKDNENDIPNWTLFGVHLVGCEVHKIITDSDEILYNSYVVVPLDDGKDKDIFDKVVVLNTEIYNHCPIQCAVDTLIISSNLFGDNIGLYVPIFNEKFELESSFVLPENFYECDSIEIEIKKEESKKKPSVFCVLKNKGEK